MIYIADFFLEDFVCVCVRGVPCIDVDVKLILAQRDLLAMGCDSEAEVHKSCFSYRKLVAGSVDANPCLMALPSRQGVLHLLMKIITVPLYFVYFN